MQPPNNATVRSVLKLVISTCILLTAQRVDYRRVESMLSH